MICWRGPISVEISLVNDGPSRCFQSRTLAAPPSQRLKLALMFSMQFFCWLNRKKFLTWLAGQDALLGGLSTPRPIATTDLAREGVAGSSCVGHGGPSVWIKGKQQDSNTYSRVCILHTPGAQSKFVSTVMWTLIKSITIIYIWW